MKIWFHKYILILLLLVNQSRLYSQNIRVYRCQEHPIFCSSTISFVKGGEFVYDRGCEESSYLCFGRWYKNGDKIKLEPYNRKELNIEMKVSYSIKVDSVSKIMILDKYNTDISEKINFNLKDSITNAILMTTYNRYEAKKHFPNIHIATLENIFGREFYVKNNFEMDLIIKLNIPEYYIVNGYSVWKIPETLDYIVESNCLRTNNEMNRKYFCEK